MQITRASMFTGKVHTWDLAITEEQIQAWRNGMLIQDAFPDLTADEREFLKTGVTPEEWNQYFDYEE